LNLHSVFRYFFELNVFFEWQSGSDNPETVAEAAQAAFIDHTIEDMQRQAATQTQQQGELSEAQRYEKMSGSARRKATRQRRAEAKLVTHLFLFNHSFTFFFYFIVLSSK
jgi:UDP:flavonoid glycosyltransferase YjiC (YdhE family)